MNLSRDSFENVDSMITTVGNVEIIITPVDNVDIIITPIDKVEDVEDGVMSDQETHLALADRAQRCVMESVSRVAGAGEGARSVGAEVRTWTQVTLVDVSAGGVGDQSVPRETLTLVSRHCYLTHLKH